MFDDADGVGLHDSSHIVTAIPYLALRHSLNEVFCRQQLGNVRRQGGGLRYMFQQTENTVLELYISSRREDEL